MTSGTEERSSERQLEKFKQAACQLEVDKDEARGDGQLNKVAKHKGAPEKPE